MTSGSGMSFGRNRIAIAKGLQHADAEDLTQDVLANVRRSLALFEHRGSGSFRGWLFQITRNLVVNHLTRSKGLIGSGDSNVQDLLLQKPDRDDDTAGLFEADREAVVRR
jgi:RNA polymerase sigma-70 factor (ECF subfamily)